MIVGSSRGIGAAIRHRLDRDGWNTLDISRTSRCDVTDRQWFDRALWNAGMFDAFIYCAGHVEPKPLAELTDGEWSYHLDVNLTAAFRALRVCASRPNPPGAIVFVASTAGTRASPEWGAYAAAKAGLINLALTAAAELAPRGIRVYCIAPGRCATQLRARLAPSEDPAGIMQPVEVADVVATLLADHAGVLAGQVLEVKRR